MLLLMPVASWGKPTTIERHWARLIATFTRLGGEQEIQATLGGVAVAGGERMDRHRRLLALELVHRAHPGLVAEAPLQAIHLQVVGRSDQDVFAGEYALNNLHPADLAPHAAIV